MKVIELLNKIANYDKDIPNYIEYYNKETVKRDKMLVCEENIIYYMNRGALFLNDEVEIIEEDNKIEQKENYVDFVNLKDDEKFDYLYEMISRIIDKVNKLGD